MTNCSRSRTGINSNTDARDADDEALKRSGSDFRPCNSQQSFAVMFMLHLAKRTISGRTGCLRVPPEQAIEVLGNASTDRASPRMLPGCVRNNAATSITEAPVKARTRRPGPFRSKLPGSEAPDCLHNCGLRQSAPIYGSCPDPRLNWRLTWRRCNRSGCRCRGR